ncbi:Glutamate--tRNA ligase [Fusobacterium sp. DD29]|uniref:glutamate--tRNA ligase n=1 Tax=unclassified Fusobacterium TaxID=2648384 RepID=UPI001B8CDFDE|nr:MULTISPECIES: glutamate--tRNA ligase [unclassified Fusobacterium]MBR8750099.1 Glutamate--tRNA ligase [Fusobacterium sp. DD29]MBR8762341.1 Glutamate--tRNA ligase [Fusobacterium sp. DD25]MBR8768370.1 Glutamate--tRNA ligase [Fusobacterium sp. DD43]MBR8772441.1 Glutamate--tRNA ligase [Fusobacterium sp. DD40]MBR8776653.1 Glutamate--tRNA ligase [Fusobacterium sp. DD17]
MDKKVRTRIAPSPTGDPHVGTAYIALFNLAFANSQKGDFILRIEDTDQNRYTEGSEQMIFDAMHWLDLNYAEGPDVGGEYGPYRQSERFHLYGEYAKKLVEQGGAYYCFCSQDRLEKLRERQKAMGKAPGYDGHCRSLTPEEVQAKLDAGEPYVIRLKMPYEGETVIKDRLRGDIVFENNKIDDQVLLKADGFPTYHLANVVDDHLMGITHVIRAEEWIASTPKHIQLYKAFGWDQPEFIHMPLLRNADRTKISKRKNPVSLNWYKEQGYLKEGMINFLGLMGYSFGENKEIFTLQEFIDNFNIDKVSLGGPVFDLVKLGWVNNQHMRMKDIDELTKLAIPFFKKAGFVGETVSDHEYRALVKIVEILRESAQTLKEIAEESAVYFNDTYELPVVTEDMNKKERKSVEKLNASIEDPIGKEAIKLFIKKLEAWDKEDFTVDEAKDMLHSTMDELEAGPGKVFMPLRAVITGQARGADLFNVLYIIGKTRTLARIKEMVRKYNII